MSRVEQTGVLVVQHMPHEGPYAIGTALEAAGLLVRVCRTWAGDPVPESSAGLAALVMMGGPMAAYDYSPAFPTRAAELTLLRFALEAEESGAWDEKYGFHRTLPEFHGAVRLIVGH
ncbi:hypothetical protein [Streptomyces sp. NPDC057557]|uniref:hypothetical protein n=1 Tax=Streptomyces sp. NPDC057557 TaxID=3346167 RepID=UPI0036A32CDD